MELTREECKKALDELFDNAASEYEIDEDDGNLICYDYTTHDKYLKMREPLDKLIKEHFDNPPLTHDEIGLLGMPVYYLPEKEWLLFNDDWGGEYMTFIDFEGREIKIPFEEKRFYRKEVKG